MVNKAKINRFIKSQRTFTAQGPEYKLTQKALYDVLLALPDNVYMKVTKNLILSVLHEKPLGQFMHMKSVKGKFMIMQLTVPKDVPIEVLKYVIAHELGHAMQGRNWRKSDGNKLESGADSLAAEWGFPKTKKIKHYMDKRAERFSQKSTFGLFKEIAPFTKESQFKGQLEKK